MEYSELVRPKKTKAKDKHDSKDSGSMARENNEIARRSSREVLSIALVHALNKHKNYSMNKDLNSGFGTADDFGNSLTSRIIKLIRRKAVQIPILSFAFLQSVLREQGHHVNYFEGTLPEGDFDLILIYGSIVDYQNENRVCKLLKENFPDARVGFLGPFPSRFPDLFDSGDFVLLGEAEAFFMNQFRSIDQLKGSVPVTSLTDMDSLPTPDFDNFPIKNYGYAPAISQKPFVTLQASKGCPYSCKFYCTYGEYQGPKIRLRSAKKVVDDIVYLQQKFDIKGMQFRDPIFGFNKNFIPDLCEELKKRKVKIKWGMETRLDLLNEENLKQMFEVGLRNINVGIETNDVVIAKINKRPLVKESHQEKIIKVCEKIGITVAAFYILALEGDTEETMRNTIQYAIKLNTPLARFAVSTPYPGTDFFEQLEKEGRILTHNYEEYTQFNLVFKHKNLSAQRVKQLLEEAYRRYYFRPSYFSKLLKWKVREFWL